MADTPLTQVYALLGFKVDESGLRQADKEAKGFGDRFQKFLAGAGTALQAGALGFGIKKVFDQVHQLAEEDDRIAKLSDALGVSAQTLRAWENAGSLAGASAEDLRGGLQRLSASLFDASQGGAQQVKAFQALGIAGEELKDGNLENILPKIFDGFQKLESGARRTALTRDLFGRGGLSLIPFLSTGSAGLEELRTRFERLGGTVDRDALKRSEEFNDALTDLNVSITALKRSILIGLVVPLKSAALWLAETIAQVRQFDERTGLVTRTLKILAGALTLGTGLKVFSLLTGLTRGFIGALGGVVPLLQGIARWTLLTAAPWLLALVAAEDFVAFLQGKDSIIGAIINSWFGEETTKLVRDFFGEFSEGESNILHMIRQLDVASKATTDFASKAKNEFAAAGLAFVNSFVHPLEMIDTLTTSIAQHILDLSSKIAGALGLLKGPTTIKTAAQLAADQNAAPATELLPNFGADLPTVGTVPSVVSAGGGAGNVVTLGETTINVSVPAGTPGAQVNAITQNVKRAVDDRNRAALNALEVRR